MRERKSSLEGMMESGRWAKHAREKGEIHFVYNRIFKVEKLLLL